MPSKNEFVESKQVQCPTCAPLSESLVIRALLGQCFKKRLDVLQHHAPLIQKSIMMSAWNLDNARTLISTLQVVLPSMDKLDQNLVSSVGLVSLLFRFLSLFFPLSSWRQRDGDEA